MGKISVLPPQLANMISAGEVVERPASVVKELVENSLDAGARHITVEIKNGGITYIRVTDDGCGMDAEDAAKAFLCHATSKIKKQNDLEAITTLGFRGEALASIASVSKTDMFTRITSKNEGCHIAYEGGKMTEQEETGCAIGTNIIVRDLFFNTPARSKFMKKDSTEGACVEDVVLNAAIAFPQVSFKLIKDGRDRFMTPGDGELKKVIAAVYDKDLVNGLMFFDADYFGTGVSGYISAPDVTRASRNMQSFFVNDRPVKSKLLTAAVDEGYKNRIMVGRQPVVYIKIKVPPSSVDVNVHPAKTEIKFAKEKEIFSAVRNCIANALDSANPKEAALIQQKLSAGKKKQNTDEYRNENITYNSGVLRVEGGGLYNSPNDKHGIAADISAIVNHYDRETGGFVQKLVEVKDGVATELPITEEQKCSVSYFEDKKGPDGELELRRGRVLSHNVRIAGEIFNTYILAEFDNCLWIVDKHAAHERRLYNEFREKDFEKMAQYLLTPKVVSLPMMEKEVVVRNAERFMVLGFEVEDYGGNSVVVRAIPQYLDENDIAATLSELADKMISNRADETKTFDDLLKSIACKGAVKAGMPSSPEELLKLVIFALNDADMSTCPHGRPTAIKVSRRQLEKNFRRIV